MGRTANLSPMGLLNWDNTIFDLMQIPSQLNRDTLINNILAETMELEVLYPNPTVFKNLLGVWSAKQIDVWNRLFATTQYEYNPIENYNRYEEGSDSGSGSVIHSGTDTTTETSRQGGMDTHSDALTNGGSDSFTDSIEHDGQDTDTGTKESGHWIAGFDSRPAGEDDGLVKQTRDEDTAETTHDYGHTIEEEGSTTYGKTESRTGNVAYGKTETKNGTLAHGETVTSENDGEHELHAHGNIGVTTTQKLIREQREVDKFNLYDIITDEFKMRFCILVY